MKNLKLYRLFRLSGNPYPHNLIKIGTKVFCGILDFDDDNNRFLGYPNGFQEVRRLGADSYRIENYYGGVHRHFSLNDITYIRDKNLNNLYKEFRTNF